MDKKPTDKPSAVRRSPHGMNSGKPVAVRFTQKELEKLHQVADVEQRTVSAVARLATLRGLAEYEKDPRALLVTSDT